MNTPKTESEIIIERTLKWEDDCKRETVLSILRYLNDICARGNISYIVINRLMNCIISGEDMFQKSKEYSVALMRTDYDKLMDILRNSKPEDGFSFSDTYSKSGTVMRTNALLSRHDRYKGELGAFDITIGIRLIPFDILPSDEEERNEFIKNVTHETKQYIKDSTRTNSYRKAGSKGSVIGRLINKVRSFIDTNTFDKRKNDYLDLVTRYSDISDPEYAGHIELVQNNVIRISSLLPATEMDFFGVKVNIPAEPEVFSSSRDTERVMKLRKEMIGKFDKLCADNDITYFLGWELNSEFIHNWQVSDEKRKRWDIGLLRKDYDKLIDVIRETKTEFALQEFLDNRPTIHKNGISLGFKDDPAKNKVLKDFPVYLVPFDYMPDDLEEGGRFCQAAIQANDRLDQVINCEKGQSFVELKDGETSATSFAELQKQLASYPGETGRLLAMRSSELNIYSTDSILPLKRIDVDGMSLNVPANQFLWHNDVDNDYVEYAASYKTEIIKRLNALCEENDIEYFAIASLLSAAVIYHDVIADGSDKGWEVALVRDDYNKLIEILRDSGEKYGLTLEEYIDKDCKVPYVTKRIMLPDVPFNQMRVDILPFDKIPDDFYIGIGFTNMMREKSSFFRELIKVRKMPHREYRSVFKGEKLDRVINYINTADPVKEYGSIDELAQSFNDTKRPFKYGRVAFRKSSSISAEDLFPLQKVKFRDTVLSCPKDTSVWQPVIDDELKRQVDCIQKADLILIKEFDRICKELGLGYFVCGGTMLGYVRHQGFIPWDDDVDVAMLRKDYEAFLEKAGEHLSSKFFLQTRESDKTIPYLFSKLRLNDTEYVTEYSDVRGYHKGICLDIFPFDYLPNDMNERKEFLREIRKLSKAHHMTAEKQLYAPEEECVPENETEKQCIEYEKAVLKEAWGTDLAETQAEYLEVATRYNSRAKELGLTTVGSFVPTYTYIDLSDLLPYQRGMFQGVEVSVPKRPDIFLAMQYGDYMQLPPEHQRIAHRLIRWKTWEASGPNRDDGGND